MFRSLRRGLLSIVAVSASIVSTVHGHFVWILTEPTATGLAVRSGFGESDGWDPDLIDRMSKTTFRLRTADGFSPLAITVDPAEKEYRTVVGGTKPIAVTAATDFGVIQFGGNPPSWLRYTAKNLVGAPDQWNDATPTPETRIEVLAKLEGDKVALRVLHLGKPLAKSVIKAKTPQGDAVELTTDEAGAANWPVAGTGVYALFVGTTLPEPGELDGQKYDVLKDYATLTFRLP